MHGTPVLINISMLIVTSQVRIDIDLPAPFHGFLLHKTGGSEPTSWLLSNTKFGRIHHLPSTPIRRIISAKPKSNNPMNTVAIAEINNTTIVNAVSSLRVGQ